MKQDRHDLFIPDVFWVFLEKPFHMLKILKYVHTDIPRQLCEPNLNEADT